MLTAANNASGGATFSFHFAQADGPGLGRARRAAPHASAERRAAASNAPLVNVEVGVITADDDLPQGILGALERRRSMTLNAYPDAIRS